MTTTPVDPAPEDLPEDVVEVGTDEAPDVDPEEVDH